MGTIAVGIAFGGVFLWAFTRMRKDMKSNTCACSGGCIDKSKCSSPAKLAQFK